MLSFVMLALIGADNPAVAPWEFEARVAALETKVAALEAKVAACPCSAPIAAQTTTTVRHADGSLWTRTCGPDGCRETRADALLGGPGPGWPPRYEAIPCASCPGGVRYVQVSTEGQFAQAPSSCPSCNGGGQGAGSCANGQCGRGGGRGVGLSFNAGRASVGFGFFARRR